MNIKLRLLYNTVIFEVLCHSKDKTPVFKNCFVLYQNDCPCPDCHVYYFSKN